MRVEFAIRAPSGELLGEELLASRQAEYSSLFSDDAEGEIILRQEGGQELHIEDSLEALILNLCIRAIPDLVAGKHVVISFFSYYGYLRLDSESHLELVSGDGLQPTRFPRAELIPALFDCGQRYQRLLASIPSEEISARARYIDSESEPARQAMQQFRGR